MRQQGVTRVHPLVLVYHCIVSTANFQTGVPCRLIWLARTETRPRSINGLEIRLQVQYSTYLHMLNGNASPLQQF